MKKINLTFLLCVLLYSIDTWAQPREVSKDTVLLRGQDRGFILGLQEIHIVITQVRYDQVQEEFCVIGYVENYKNDTDSQMVDIDLYHNGKRNEKIYTTKSYGQLEVKMTQNDQLTFYGGVYEEYLTIKPPGKKRKV